VNTKKDPQGNGRHGSSKNGDANVLATLVESVDVLKKFVLRDRRTIRESNRRVSDKLVSLASRIESLEKTAAENRQLIAQNSALIEQFGLSLTRSNNGHAAYKPPAPGGAELQGQQPDGAPTPRANEGDHGLKEIDRDILKAASGSKPYMGKELAARTGKYKFNPYFRSRLSFLYKRRLLNRCGEGYRLRLPDRCGEA